MPTCTSARPHPRQPHVRQALTALVATASALTLLAGCSPNRVGTSGRPTAGGPGLELVAQSEPPREIAHPAAARPFREPEVPAPAPPPAAPAAPAPAPAAKPAANPPPKPQAAKPAAPKPAAPAPAPPAPAPAPAAPAASGNNAFASRLFALTNQARANAGLSQLRGSGCAQSVANRWANRMAEEQRMYHQDMSAIGNACPGWRRVGENVAYGNVSADTIFSMWMNSAGHRANILRPEFNQVAISAVQDGNGVWWAVQDFVQS